MFYVNEKSMLLGYRYVQRLDGYTAQFNVSLSSNVPQSAWAVASSVWQSFCVYCPFAQAGPHVLFGRQVIPAPVQSPQWTLRPQLSVTSPQLARRTRSVSACPGRTAWSV